MPRVPRLRFAYPSFSIAIGTAVVLMAALGVECGGDTETTSSLSSPAITPPTPSRTATTAPTVTRTATPSPTPATPQVVAGPAFVVNSLPVGCHERPEAAARIVVEHPLGAMQAVDQLIRRPDGTWHREVERRCWTRTDPGPVRLFTNLIQAEDYVATLRPARRLATGRFLRDAARDGQGELSVENGRQTDAVLVLTTTSAAPVLSVYIRGGESFTIRGIRDGTYQIFFMSGDDWDDAGARFTRRRGFTRFEENTTFRTMPTARGVQYSAFKITLHTVSGGTAETEPVDPGRFPAVR